MRPPRRCAGHVLAAALLGLLAACEASGRERDTPAPAGPAAHVPRGGPPVLVGTAVDAATGRALSGVTVTLPDGTTGLSDETGRFELRGMPIGLAGVLKATHKSGLVGENRLLPLASGRLEIVVRLARPRER